MDRQVLVGGGGVRIRKVGRNGGEGVIGVDGDATVVIRVVVVAAVAIVVAIDGGLLLAFVLLSFLLSR